jgi:hypothetical protein
LEVISFAQSLTGLNLVSLNSLPASIWKAWYHFQQGKPLGRDRMTYLK